MKPEQKATVTQLISQLNGKLTDTIKKANYLIMNDLRVTAKVLLALIYGIPIVSVEFVRYLLYDRPINKPMNTIIASNYLPKQSKQIPNSDISQSSQLFLVNEKRKNIFEGKIFLFDNEEVYQKANEIVIAGGGKCYIVDDENINKIDVNKTYVVINSQDVNIYKDNKNNKYKKFKIIDENQIGLSVLHTNLMLLENKQDVEHSDNNNTTNVDINNVSDKGRSNKGEKEKNNENEKKKIPEKNVKAKDKGIEKKKEKEELEEGEEERTTVELISKKRKTEENNKMEEYKNNNNNGNNVQNFKKFKKSIPLYKLKT